MRVETSCWPGLSPSNRARSSAHRAISCRLPRQPGVSKVANQRQFFDEEQWESYRKLGLEWTKTVLPLGPSLWRSVLDVNPYPKILIHSPNMLPQQHRLFDERYWPKLGEAADLPYKMTARLIIAKIIGEIFLIIRNVGLDLVGRPLVTPSFRLPESVQSGLTSVHGE